MFRGKVVVMKCICCNCEYEARSYNSCYCSSCRHDVDNLYNKYKQYCYNNAIKPNNKIIFRDLCKRYGKQAFRLSNEEVYEALEDISLHSKRNINKALKEDALAATRLGISYGQYVAKYKTR